MAYTADSKSAAREGLWVQVPLPAYSFTSTMNNLLFAIGTVLPVFLMIAVGYTIRKKGFVSAGFCETAARFNFRLCLPALVFDSLYSSDISRLFSGRLALLSLASVTVSLALASATGFAAAKDPGTRASFIQGAFRGNIILLGMPMVVQVFGEDSRAQTAILMAIIVPAYNVFSVIILALGAKGSGTLGPRAIAKSVLTNPMILGVLAALPFALAGLALPAPIMVFIRYFAGMTVPLALVDIGSGMVGRSRLSHPGRVLAAAALKTAATPFIYGAIFVFGGMEGHIVALMVLLGATPTAMASFTMAKVMGCEAELSGDIVMASTLMSAFTISGAIIVLRAIGLA